MGWKGTVRSINAAAKRADRNAKKRQREIEKKQKQYAKMQELEQAAYEVEAFENHIEIVQSMHKECGDEINWPTRPAVEGWLFYGRESGSDGLLSTHLNFSRVSAPAERL